MMFIADHDYDYCGLLLLLLVLRILMIIIVTTIAPNIYIVMMMDITTITSTTVHNICSYTVFMHVKALHLSKDTFATLGMV